MGKTIMNGMGARWRELALLAGIFGACMGSAANAALPDEIQVYTFDINAPREFGLEVHINTTPSGQRVPAYPGEVSTYHGWRLTPEFSYGLAKNWEAGLYVPTVRAADGSYYLAGAKLRLKWLPLQAGQDGQDKGGWFAGVNGELGRITRRFDTSRSNLELRFIAGWKNADWLLAVNPIFGWALSDGQREGTPEGTLSLKVARNVAQQLALGLEYYSAYGKVSQVLPLDERDNRLFLAIDYAGKPFAFNFGVGRGQTAGADKWTVKAIIDVPF
jgi:hypothetical protein